MVREDAKPPCRASWVGVSTEESAYAAAPRGERPASWSEAWGGGRSLGTGLVAQKRAWIAPSLCEGRQRGGQTQEQQPRGSATQGWQSVLSAGHAEPSGDPEGGSTFLLRPPRRLQLGTRQRPTQMPRLRKTRPTACPPLLLPGHLLQPFLPLPPTQTSGSRHRGIAQAPLCPLGLG